MVLKVYVAGLQRLLTSVKVVPRAPPRLDPRYGTWVLSRVSGLNAGRVQPVLEVEKVILNEAELISSIEKRKLDNQPDVRKVAQLFGLAKQLKENQQKAERNKEENAEKVQTLLYLIKENRAEPSGIKNLRETGKKLRDDLRRATLKFNETNDELIDLVLSLPNLVDPVTPLEEARILREVVPPDGVERWKYPTNLQWERIPAAGPYTEFPGGSAVWMELDLASKCQSFLLENGFCETGNVDFVKRVLLDGSGLDPDQFLKIREARVKNSGSGIAHATYLVGGASFPAFLALFAQSMIQDESMFPIRYFVVGRMYSKRQDGPGTHQACAVQVFIGCRDYVEEEAEYHRLTDLMEKFYSEHVGISFQTRLVPAPYLRTYESKKTSFVVPDRGLVVGDLSTAGEYVSKRLLCCYANTERSPKFMSMITGKFMNITDFIRPLGLDSNSEASDPANQSYKTDDGFLLPPRYSESEPPPKNPPTKEGTEPDDSTKK